MMQLLRGLPRNLDEQVCGVVCDEGCLSNLCRGAEAPLLVAQVVVVKSKLNRLVAL